MPQKGPATVWSKATTALAEQAVEPTALQLIVGP